MGEMFQTLGNALRVKDIRKRMLFTLFIIVIFRLGTAMPVPAIDTASFTELFNRFGQLGQFMDIISGGAFKSVSILALGITPYINSSIIMQLLTFAIPSLERLSKEGEEGQKKIKRYTRFLTLAIALVMSISYALLTKEAANANMPSWLAMMVIILSFTGGALFVMWLGELIDDKGIGNGISLIIFTGIVSRLPSYLPLLYSYFQGWRVLGGSTFLAVLGVIIVIAFFIAMVTLVVYVQSAERRIPIQYSKRVVGRKVYGGQGTYLPIKVNQSGVLPVIFAMSLLMVAPTIASMTGSTGKVATWFLELNQNPLYYVIYALLILLFVFFYSTISFNPIDIANNLQKNGGYILGIRPGRPTAEFIGKTARRLNWFEAIFLMIVVLLPSIIGLATNTQGVWFGGTAVIILVGVSMDLVTQMEAQLLMRHYKGFLD